MTKEELIIGFFEKGYCCDLDEVKDTCLDLLKENQELKAELQLYKGALKRENEAIHRVNDLEEVIKKAIEYINKSLIISSILDGKKTYCLNNYTFDYRELLEILKGGSNE